MNAWIIIPEEEEILFITLQGTCSFRPRKSLKTHERLAACGRAASSLGSLQTALFTLAPIPLSVCTVSIDRRAEAQRRTRQSRKALWVTVVASSRRFSVNETNSTNICTFSFLLAETPRTSSLPQPSNAKLSNHYLPTYYYYPYNTNRHCHYACVGKPLSKQPFHKCRQYKGRNAIKCKNYAEQWTYINTNMHKCTCSRVHMNTRVKNDGASEELTIQ